jgi:lysophospholipase L1-like esterase
MTASFAFLEFALRVSLVGLTHADGDDSNHASAPTLDLRSIPREKPAGIKRLLCLGDSVTVGAGCKKDSIYSEHLARLLGEGYGDSFEVLNISHVAWNTQEELGALKSEGLSYSPDLIVLGFVLNDAEPDGPAFHLSTLLPRNLDARLSWSYNINLLNFMYDKSLQLSGRKDDYTQYLLKLYREGQRGLEQCKADHREMLRIAKENDIKFLAVLFPAFVQFEDYPFQEVHESVSGWLQQYGAVTVDLLPYYRKYKPKDLIASFMDGHPNSLGHKIAADAIYETIRTHPDLKSFLDRSKTENPASP